MAKVFTNLEEALEAQTKQKKEVEKVKKELTTYFTKNKLKRDVDYTDDPKHGPKIAKLEKEIDKKEETMAKVNEQVKNLEKSKKGKAAKPAKKEKAPKETKAKKESKGEGRTTKYEYPTDCDTPQKKKAFRVAARAAEKNGKPTPTSYKEVMEAKSEKAAKKEKAPKAEKPAKKEKAAKEEVPAKKSKKASKEAPAKEEKTSKKKKAKKVEDD